ncbi:MAG: type IV pilin protein [Gammaproteobacteria bacterium]
MKIRFTKGFTLIELMITVAIVGILAGIAYPSYQEQVRSSRRAECGGALMGLANAMERHFTTNNSYLGAGATAGNTGTPIPAVYNATCPLDGGTATYDLTIDAATQTSYTLHAAPIAGGPQASDKCGTFTLTSIGVRSLTGQHSGITPNDCW